MITEEKVTDELTRAIEDPFETPRKATISHRLKTMTPSKKATGEELTSPSHRATGERVTTLGKKDGNGSTPSSLKNENDMNDYVDMAVASMSKTKATPAKVQPIPMKSLKKANADTGGQGMMLDSAYRPVASVPSPRKNHWLLRGSLLGKLPAHTSLLYHICP